MARPQTVVDLASERARTSFSVRDLTYVLYGSQERVELKASPERAEGQAA